MTSNNIVTLLSGPTRLQVCPAAGGAITRFWHDDGKRVLDWLRPVSEVQIAELRGSDLGCYPLVPFCSRIRDGQFQFQEQSINLPRNMAGQKHPLHGQGWLANWGIASRRANRLVIEYRHQADSWPWDYLARQTFILETQSLSVELQVENLASKAMPAGIGIHPFFKRTEQATVSAAIERIWLTDAEVMPLQLAPPQPQQDLNQGLRVEQSVLDNNYTGWSGEAYIHWPEWRASMKIQATEPFDKLVVYSPSEQGFFCVEPVSNVTDAFNLAAQGDSGTGTRVLAAGESLSGTASFSYEFK